MFSVTHVNKNLRANFVVQFWSKSFNRSSRNISWLRGYILAVSLIFLRQFNFFSWLTYSVTTNFFLYYVASEYKLGSSIQCHFEKLAFKFWIQHHFVGWCSDNCCFQIWVDNIWYTTCIKNPFLKWHQNWSQPQPSKFLSTMAKLCQNKD